MWVETIRIPDLYNNKKDPCASPSRVFMCEKVSLIGKNYDWEILRGKNYSGEDIPGLGIILQRATAYVRDYSLVFCVLYYCWVGCSSRGR